ncbi:hypothetical protein KUTeg_019464 [Tegillarca granosa]|uniref:C2H2-type domain-containing protein n=1 Tax=Tegillarca granosa TaxID=220873 RepID=A0ABQ9ECM1_TEGGR|nr:hypothetical protein KUTeg_019464 [Tegillarca granosa]
MSTSMVQGNKCPFCDVCFMNIDQLCIHIKTHGSVVMTSGDIDGQINISNGSTVTLSSADQIRLAVNDSSRADISDKTRLGVLEEGRLTMNEVLVCPYCFCSDFDSLEILEIHMQSVHSVKPTEVYTCNYCNAPYQNLYSLHEHMRAVHQEQPCMDIKYPCGICTQHFPSIDALVQHKRSAHYNNPQEVHGVEPLFCIYCQMTFKNPRELREHMMMNQSHIPSQPSDQKHYKEQIICDHCNSIFYDMKNFEAHMKYHPNSACKICKENFASEDRLEKHASNHYLSMTTEYGCTTCMKLFSKPDELQKHLMDIHAHHLYSHSLGYLLLHIYRCSLCKEIFDSKVNIQVHFAIKHSNECKLYKCTKCESVFRSEMEWQVHVRVNHLHVAKPYRCLFCKESFTAEIDLQCHLTTHNKPFRCSMCEESFHVEYLLDKHLQSKHSNNSDHVVLPQLSPLKIKVERDTTSSSTHFTTSPKSVTGNDGIGNWKNSDFISESSIKSLLASPSVKSEELGIWKNYESSVKTGHSSTSPKSSESYIKPADVNMKTMHCSPSPKTGNLSIWKSSELFHTCNICDAKFEQQSLLLTHKAVDHGLSAKISSASSSPTLNESPRQEQQIAQQQQTTQQQHTTEQAAQLQQSRVVNTSELINGTMSLPVVVVSEKVSLACMFCSQTFKNRADLDKHVKIHSNGGSQKCNICDQIFPTSSILAEHKLTHCKIQYGNLCVLCKIPLKNEEHFYVHTQEHGYQNSGFMQCLICRQTLSSMVELQMHGKHHFQIKPSFFTCCVCLKTFDTKENLVSKLNSSGRTYYVCKPCYHGDSGSTHLCQQCGAQFSNAKHLEAHTCTHSKNTYQCIKCQESFNSEYEIQLHVATHVLNEGNTHECKLCSETFESPAKLQCHLIEHTYKDSEFRCSVCCKLFQSSLEIQTHAIEHGLNSRRYACNQCPQKFFFSAELENHMFSHADHSKICCNQCDRTFTSVINLNNHMKIHEKKEQNFKCSLCPKVLDSMNALQQHFFSGHSNSELATTKKVYPCTECDKEFPCLSNLQGHMRIHKPGKENRKAHLRSHGGLKPFLCPKLSLDTPAAEMQSVIEVDVNGDPANGSSEDTCSQEVNMEESTPLAESSPLVESSREEVAAAD